MALANNQHVFRYDDRSSRTFTACDGTVCGVSPTSAGLRAVPARASADARFDFGGSHFAARLEDGAFFVNETTLTVRDARGQPDGLGTVFDASALGVANPTSATGHAV